LLVPQFGSAPYLMTIKLATCWLLFTLSAGAALAQTHPKKKPNRKRAVADISIPYTFYPLTAFCGIDDGTQLEPAAVTFDSTYIYTYVEQMPTLNGQPLQLASKAAIEQRMVVPPAAPDGRVFVGFDISKTGSVHNVRMLKGLRADLDSAVVTATRQLPRFMPGKQSGHVVVVRAVVPITIPVKQP
jgi:hypothetical protein